MDLHHVGKALIPTVPMGTDGMDFSKFFEIFMLCVVERPCDLGLPVHTPRCLAVGVPMK